MPLGAASAGALVRPAATAPQVHDAAATRCARVPPQCCHLHRLYERNLVQQKLTTSAVTRRPRQRYVTAVLRSRGWLGVLERLRGEMTGSRWVACRGSIYDEVFKPSDFDPYSSDEDEEGVLSYKELAELHGVESPVPASLIQPR